MTSPAYLEPHVNYIYAFTYSSNHAWGGSADLKVVLADSGSVEHREERGDLIDLHWGHLENLGSLVHGRQSQEVVVLLLSKEQYWKNTR